MSQNEAFAAAALTSTLARNVIVNVRIDSEETRRAGVDMHVCEIQLTLRGFAELKVMHSRTELVGWVHNQNDRIQSEFCVVPHMDGWQ
jgi:hypothetical protein